MQRDLTYLADMLSSAQLALQYVENTTWSDFTLDNQLQDSVIRRLEVIGEAARRVSENTRKQHPHLSWREMINMRNLMIHKYDVVDVQIVWETLQQNVPTLIEKLQKILESEN